MPRTNTTKSKSAGTQKRMGAEKPTGVEKRGTNAFQLREAEQAGQESTPLVHVLKKGIRCDTDDRGHATPQGRTPLEIRVDSSEGFIPLWAQDTTLRWRFQERSMRFFSNRQAAKRAITELLGEALIAWGDAAPVKFAQRDDAWDFEIVMRRNEDCDINGCVLASAFFPDAGRHELVLYPTLFTQSREEQVETLVHEIGHVFGLRHFFAHLRETRWPSEVFGSDAEFSIMNYGEMSQLTDADRSDLKRLYQMAWSGELTHINGTPIRLVKPFHSVGETPENMVIDAQFQTVLQPQLRGPYVTPRSVAGSSW